jgi:hypothetical protein
MPAAAQCFIDRSVYSCGRGLCARGAGAARPPRPCWTAAALVGRSNCVAYLSYAPGRPSFCAFAIARSPTLHRATETRHGWLAWTRRHRSCGVPTVRLQLHPPPSRFRGTSCLSYDKYKQVYTMCSPAGLQLWLQVRAGALAWTRVANPAIRENVIYSLPITRSRLENHLFLPVTWARSRTARIHEPRVLQASVLHQ